MPHTCKANNEDELSFFFLILKSIGPGRIVTACLSMVGIAFFSLPAVC